MVARGGPARAAALARVSTARAVVLSALRATVRVDDEATEVRVGRAVAAWTPQAIMGTMSDAPVTAWWLRVG